MTRFPVRVGDDEQDRKDLDESTFARDYDKIWTPSTVKAVLDEDPTHIGTHPGALFYGVGCGEVWFRKSKEGDFKITGFDISLYRAAGLSIQDCYGVRDFVTQLQKSVAADDRARVTAMVKYPLRYHGQRQNVSIHDEAEMRRKYEVVFSPLLRRAIAEQKVWDLGGNMDGVATDNGFVWINKTSKDGPFRVISIFEPPSPN